MRNLLAATMVLTMAGCATTSGIAEAAPDAGNATIIHEPYEAVFAAAPAAIRKAGFSLRDTQTEEGESTIIAAKGVSAFSWGELVRVRLRRLADAQTEVRVVTRRRLVTNITAPWDHSERIFRAIQKELREEKAPPS